MPDLSAPLSIGLGVMFAFFGSLASATGLSLIKKGHIIKKETRARRLKGKAKLLTIVGNLMLTAISSTMDMISLLFAPIEIMAALSGVTLILNIFVSPLIVDEHVYAIDWAACAVMVPGLALTVAFGPSEEPTMTVQLMGDLWGRQTWLIFEICAALVMITLAALYRASIPLAAAARPLSSRSLADGSKRSLDASTRDNGVVKAPSDGTVAFNAPSDDTVVVKAPSEASAVVKTPSDGTVAAPSSVVVAVNSPAPMGVKAAAPGKDAKALAFVSNPDEDYTGCHFVLWKLRPFLVPVTAAVLGAQQLVFTKLAIMLLDTSVSTDDNQFVKPTTYLIILLAVCSSLYQVYLVNVGLHVADALLVVPTYQATLVLASVFTASTYFDSLGGFEWYELVFFVVGVVLVVIGVSLLAFRPVAMPQLPPDDEDDSDSSSTTSSGGNSDAGASKDTDVVRAPSPALSGGVQLVDVTVMEEAKAEPTGVAPTISNTSSVAVAPTTSNTSNVAGRDSTADGSDAADSQAAGVTGSGAADGTGVADSGAADGTAVADNDAADRTAVDGDDAADGSAVHGDDAADRTAVDGDDAAAVPSDSSDSRLDRDGERADGAPIFRRERRVV